MSANSDFAFAVSDILEPIHFVIIMAKFRSLTFWGSLDIVQALGSVCLVEKTCSGWDGSRPSASHCLRP